MLTTAQDQTKGKKMVKLFAKPAKVVLLSTTRRALALPLPLATSASKKWRCNLPVETLYRIDMSHLWPPGKCTLLRLHARTTRRERADTYSLVAKCDAPFGLLSTPSRFGSRRGASRQKQAVTGPDTGQRAPTCLQIRVDGHCLLLLLPVRTRQLVSASTILNEVCAECVQRGPRL